MLHREPLHKYCTVNDWLRRKNLVLLYLGYYYINVAILKMTRPPQANPSKNHQQVKEIVPLLL